MWLWLWGGGGGGVGEAGWRSYLSNNTDETRSGCYQTLTPKQCAGVSLPKYSGLWTNASRSLFKNRRCAELQQEEAFKRSHSISLTQTWVILHPSRIEWALTKESEVRVEVDVLHASNSLYEFEWEHNILHHIWSTIRGRLLSVIYANSLQRYRITLPMPYIAKRL